MSSNKIVLTSSDGESFEVEEVVARKMQIVGYMIEEDIVINAIPLQNVTAKILAMVIEYCKKHVDDVAEEESEEVKKKKADSTEEEKEEAEKKKLELETWDAEFMKNFDLTTIFGLILAANYLNVKGLLDLTSQTVADYIKEKTVEEVREIFNVENDYTAEEEAEVRKEYERAYKIDPPKNPNV